MDVSLLKVDAAVRQARDAVASSVRAAASDPSHVVALSCPLGIMEPHLAMLQGDGVESLATPSAEWPLSVADMLESLHDAQDMLCAEYQHRHGRHTRMAFVVHHVPAFAHPAAARLGVESSLRGRRSLGAYGRTVGPALRV